MWFTSKITYLGSEKDIAETAKIIKKHRSLKQMEIKKARLKIQELIDKHNLKASILLNGKPVWSKKRILNNLHRIRKYGTLYNPKQSKPPILSQYFYQLLHMECGSVAHYDIHGWIHKYPTIRHMKTFFQKNEFGVRVLDWVPDWKSDVKAIVKAVEGLLYPFKTFMETREGTED